MHHLWSTIPWYRYQYAYGQVGDALAERGARIGWRVDALPEGVARRGWESDPRFRTRAIGREATGTNLGSGS